MSSPSATSQRSSSSSSCEQHLPLPSEQEQSNQKCAEIACEILSFKEGEVDPQYQAVEITQKGSVSKCAAITAAVFHAAVVSSPPNRPLPPLPHLPNGAASKDVGENGAPPSDVDTLRIDAETIERWIEERLSAEQAKEEIPECAKRLIEKSIFATEKEVETVILRMQKVPTPENAALISPSLYLRLLDAMLAYFDRAMMHGMIGLLSKKTRENYQEALGRWNDQEAFFNRLDDPLQSLAIRYRHDYLNESLKNIVNENQWWQDIQKPVADALAKLLKNNPLALKDLYDIIKKNWGNAWYIILLGSRVLTYPAINDEEMLKGLKRFLGKACCRQDGGKDSRLIYAGSMALAQVMIHSEDSRIREQAWSHTDEQTPGFAYWVEMFCRENSFLHRQEYQTCAESFLAVFFTLCAEMPQGTLLDKKMSASYSDMQGACHRFKLRNLLKHFSEHPLRSPLYLDGEYPPRIPLSLPSKAMTFPEETRNELSDNAAKITAVEATLTAYLEGADEKKCELLRNWCEQVDQCRENLWRHIQKLSRWIDRIQPTLDEKLDVEWNFTLGKNHCCQAIVDRNLLRDAIDKGELTSADDMLERLVSLLEQVPAGYFIDREFLQTIIAQTHRLVNKQVTQQAKDAVYKRLNHIMVHLSVDQQVQLFQEAADSYCQAPVAVDHLSIAAAYYYQAWKRSKLLEKPPLTLEPRFSYLLALHSFIALGPQAERQQGSTLEISPLLSLFEQIEIFRKYLKGEEFLAIDRKFEKDYVLPLVRRVRETHFLRLENPPTYNPEKVKSYFEYCKQLLSLLEKWGCHEPLIDEIKEYYKKIKASSQNLNNGGDIVTKVSKRQRDLDYWHADTFVRLAFTKVLPCDQLKKLQHFWQNTHREWSLAQQTFRDAVRDQKNLEDALRAYGKKFRETLSYCLGYCTDAIGRENEGAFCLFPMETDPYEALFTDKPLTIALLVDKYHQPDYWREFSRCFAMIVHTITGHRIELHHLGQNSSERFIGTPEELAKTVAQATADGRLDPLARALALVHGSALTVVQAFKNEPLFEKDTIDALWNRYWKQLSHDTIADDEEKGESPRESHVRYSKDQTRQKQVRKCLQILKNQYFRVPQWDRPIALTWLLAWLRAIAWYHDIFASDPFDLIEKLSKRMQLGGRELWMIHPDFLQDVREVLIQEMKGQVDVVFADQQFLEEKEEEVASVKSDSRFLSLDLKKDILEPAFLRIDRYQHTLDSYDPVWDPLEDQLNQIDKIYLEHVRLQKALKKTHDGNQHHILWEYWELAKRCVSGSALKKLLVSEERSVKEDFTKHEIDDPEQVMKDYLVNVLREILRVKIRRTRHCEILHQVDSHLSVYRRLSSPLRALYRTELNGFIQEASCQDHSRLKHLHNLLMHTPDPDGSRPCYAANNSGNPFVLWHQKMRDIIQPEPPAGKTPIRVQWYDPYQGRVERGYLKALIQEQLIDEKSAEMRFDKKLSPARCRVGQRVVIPVSFTDSLGKFVDAFAKQLPEMPIMQYQVQMLSQRISGVALPVTLCRFAPEGTSPYSVLFSEPVEATLLDHIVSQWKEEKEDVQDDDAAPSNEEKEDDPVPPMPSSETFGIADVRVAEVEQEKHFRLKNGGDLTEVESQLSGYYFTLKFFEHILMRFDDAQFANMGVVLRTTPAERQELSLIEIDADHAFADVVDEEKIAGGVKANIKTCIYTFQKCLDTVDKRAVDLFLSLDPRAVLVEWLTATDQLHKAYLGTDNPDRIFKKEEVQKLYAKNQSYVGYVIHEEILLAYHRWWQLKGLLENSTEEITLWKIFEEMEPQLAGKVYPDPRENGKNPYERFCAAKLEYDKKFFQKKVDEKKNSEPRLIHFTSTRSGNHLLKGFNKNIQTQMQWDRYKLWRFGKTKAERLSRYIGDESNMMQPASLIEYLNDFDELYRSYQWRDEEKRKIGKEIQDIYSGNMDLLRRRFSPEIVFSGMSMMKMYRVIVAEVAKEFPHQSEEERVQEVKKRFEERQLAILDAPTPAQYRRCRKLKLSGFTALTTDRLEATLIHCPDLTSLDISGTGGLMKQGEQMQLSAEVFDRISQRCQRLRCLKSSRLPKVDIIQQYRIERYIGFSVQPVDFPKLEVWEMKYSPVMQIKVAAPRLQRIELEGCDQLIRLKTGSEKVAAIEDRINFPDFDLSSVAFGKADWEKYFGEVGEEPPLPADIGKILNSPCPFWKGKRVLDTHLLVLVPKTVNGRPLTLNSLEEMIQRPQGGGHATKYRFYSDGVKREFGDQGVDQSSWVLMTKNVLEGSRYKTYDEQRALVEEHAKRSGLPYEMPHALEAAASILMHHVKTGERLYADEPWTYTRCQEKLGGGWPLGVGGFSARGLDVDYYDSYVGVGGVRKFI